MSRWRGWSVCVGSIGTVSRDGLLRILGGALSIAMTGTASRVERTVDGDFSSLVRMGLFFLCMAFRRPPHSLHYDSIAILFSALRHSLRIFKTFSISWAVDYDIMDISRPPHPDR